MTITLESISELLERGFIDAYDDPGQVKASIDAAIRERDRLRGDVSGMTEELLHVPSREEWRALQKRAERTESELAALKARIAEAPEVRMSGLRILTDSEEDARSAMAAWCAGTKRVRLVVSSDD